MLSTPPLAMPSMESFILPSQRRIVLSTSEPAITGKHSRMNRP